MNARDKYDSAASMLAAEEGYGAIVRALRAAGAEVDVKTLDSVALLEAVEAGESDAVETVLAAEADAQNQDGETALIWAAKEGHTAVVKALLAAGAEVDALNEYSYTATRR